MKTRHEIAAICDFSDRIAKEFQYFEVVYVLPDTEYPKIQAHTQKLSMLKNMRILIVSETVNVYRRRFVAASEAIGEVVVVSVPSDIETVDYAAMAAEAFSAERIMMARSRRAGKIHVYYPFMRWISNYRINRQDMKTIAVPRNILPALLERTTAPLDLRFEPKKFRFPYERMMFDAGKTNPVKTPFPERLELAVETISASVSDFLRQYALFSVLVMVGSVLYALYAVGVLLFKPDVQPGWFSTSFTQALFVFFVASALGLISLGVAEIYDRLRGREVSLLTSEISNTSFFASTLDVNVETDDCEPVAQTLTE